MGNRAVVAWSRDINSVGVYLHWNGGRDSVEGFLAYCNLKEYRSDDYGVAYLAGVITNFFADGLSCGIDTCKHLYCDNHDNGVFIVENWQIVGRVFRQCGEQLEYDLREFIKEIDNRMPEKMRLTPAQWSRFDEVAAETVAARKFCVDYKSMID